MATEVRQSETTETQRVVSPSPNVLSNDQKEYFIQLIKDNPEELRDEIQILKKKYPSELGDVEPYKVSELNDSDTVKLINRLDNYKKIKTQDVAPISSTTGNLVVAADPTNDRFVERTDAAMKNFFKTASKVDSFNLDYNTELRKLSMMISDFSQPFIGKISESVQEGLVGFLKDSMSSQATQIFTQYAAAQLPYSLALKAVTSFQGAMISPATKMFKGLECLSSKVHQAMGSVIDDLLAAMVKNMLNAPICATQQFIGALVNKIANAITNVVAPLLAPLQKILSPIGAIFDIKNKVMAGVDFMKKVGNLFKCELPKAQTSSFKYSIDGLLKKDLTDSHDSLLNGSMNAAATTNSFLDGAADGLSNFEKTYGKWSIFGSQVDDGEHDSVFTGNNCYTGNKFACGPTHVDFFGGDGGSGAKGSVILGNFLTKFDDGDIYGSFKKTAHIMGVNITDPGSGYTSPPLVSFGDNCDQGYGGYGTANIDTNPDSDTFGQVTSVTITSPGENYPVDSGLTVDGKFPEAYVDDLIIEDPGSNYREGDFISDDIRPVIDDNGRVTAIEIIEQIPYNALPDMTIRSETGYGAVIRPIMSIIKTDIDPVTEEIVENGAVRVDTSVRDIRGRRVKKAFKVVQCVGTFADRTIIPAEISRPIIEDVEQPSTPTPTPETNVPDTTTTSQTDTSADTSTPTINTSNQQATGQSDTPPPSSPPSGGGSSGSGGGYGY
jgi:hypothetical protein